MDELTKEQVEEYHKIFSKFDKDASGFIEADELATAMRAGGLNPTNADIDMMIRQPDSNGDDKVSFEEFSIMMQKCEEDTDDEKLEEAFKVFDKDDNGYITADELRDIMTTLGETLSQEEVEDMIKDADQNGDGKVNYKEFASLMKTKQF